MSRSGAGVCRNGAAAGRFGLTGPAYPQPGIAVEGSGRQFRQERVGPETIEARAIPYYAWANRDPGAMRVWIPQGLDEP